MAGRRTLRRLSILSGTMGLVLVNGCLATLERSLDLVLAPGALSNALVAPYSPVSGLVEALARFVRG